MTQTEHMPTDFTWSYTDEPHATRRKEMLAKYPEIKKLYGPHWFTKYLIAATVALQVYAASWMSNWSWPAVILFAYTLGGFCNHSLTLAMHEVSHNLAFRGSGSFSLFANRVFGIFTNLPLGIPAFASFKRYHADHHKYQGEDQLDTDVPTAIEGRLVVNSFCKVIWMILQPAFYALRPLFTVPKVPGRWEIINLICSCAFDYAIYHFFGAKGLTYLVAGTLLGMGLHPAAGHFVSEHYEFVEGAETYSYRGPLNLLAYCVGLHQQHHDFPIVAGFNLWKVREIAPEFYDTVPRHSGWAKTIWQYIVDPCVGPFSRIKRVTLKQDALTRMRAR